MLTENAKGIYLAACKARHPKYNIVYQDIDGQYQCDIGGDMLETPILHYDFIIATPPCNWWSKLNMAYFKSWYAWQTIHLLPMIIMRLAINFRGTPFIIENVINRKKFTECGIYKLIQSMGLYTQEVGRHLYISNVIFDLDCPQHLDFGKNGKRINDDGYNQGGSNVHVVIEKWLYHIHYDQMSFNGWLYE